MSSFLRGSFLTVFASFFSPLFAQEALIEKFSQQEQENGDDADHVLQELLAAPLDLNLATPAELLRLPFLARAQIEAFLSRRKTAVYFSNLEEALVALQVHSDTLALGRRVFEVSLPARAETESIWRAHARGRIAMPAEVEANWPGPKYRSYQRLRLQWQEFEAGALVERDPGENNWDDHRVFYLRWQRLRPEDDWKIIFGNYQIEWGHGLALWSAYSNNLSADAHAPARRWARSVRPFLSALENFSFYGGAVLRRRRSLQVMGFAGAQKYDVHLHEASYAVRYNLSGYHRTAREISERKNLREKTWGGGAQFGDARRAAGLLIYMTNYSLPWRVDDSHAEYFAFQGKHNLVASLSGYWRLSEATASCEVARSRSGGKAGSCIVAGEQKFLAWTLAFHHAEADFHSPHGRSPSGDDETPGGETSYSAGMTLKMNPNLTGEFYYQHAQNLWRTASLPLPPRRSRFGGQMEWKLAAASALRLRYYRNGNEYLFRENSGVSPAPQLPRYTQSIRCELVQRFANKLQLRPRFESTRELRRQMPAPDKNAAMALPQQNLAGPWGAALSLDLAWQISTKIHLSLRQVMFDTATPIYQYETDVPGFFTVTALRERGARRYIYLHLAAGRHLKMSGKIAETAARTPFSNFAAALSWGAQIDWSY